MDDARRMPAIEAGQTLTDLRTTADALRHQVQPIKRLACILFAQSIGDVNEAGMKYKRVGLEKMIEHAMHETNKHCCVKTHRARCIEQHHQPKRLVASARADQFDRQTAR